MNDNIRLKLSLLPDSPGCYLMKQEDKIIYVGKAKQLRARMRQYVNFQDTREKIPLLVSQIDSFEYIVVENEHESLVLEKNLIQQYSPYFNADFKDDTEYQSLLRLDATGTMGVLSIPALAGVAASSAP